MDESKEQLMSLEIGDSCYWAYDDRPIDGCGIKKCVVVAKEDDHLIIEDGDGIQIWADYDDIYSSCRTFKDEISAFLFLGVEDAHTLVGGGVC